MMVMVVGGGLTGGAEGGLGGLGRTLGHQGARHSSTNRMHQYSLLYILFLCISNAAKIVLVVHSMTESSTNLHQCTSSQWTITSAVVYKQQAAGVGPRCIRGA